MTACSRHAWHGTTSCFNCGMTKGRLARLNADRATRRRMAMHVARQIRQLKDPSGTDDPKDRWVREASVLRIVREAVG